MIKKYLAKLWVFISMTSKFLNYFLIHLLINQNLCIDLTLQPKEGGHDVVSKVMAKIDASGIFKQDNSFLHRIAWSMTADGKAPDTYKKNYYGGIWQIDEANYELTKNTTQFTGLVDLHEKIKLQFGIVWADTEWQDLLFPMYSGLAARLYVWTFPGDIPATLTDQADYFVNYFEFQGEKATAALFREHSKIHDQVKLLSHPILK